MYSRIRHPSRRLPTDAHKGDRAAWLARVAGEAAEAARAGGVTRAEYVARLADRLFDDRNLLLAVEYVVRSSGPARGSDGIGPADLDRAAQLRLVGVLRRSLRDGSYRPGRPRPVTIPKAGGGVRTIGVMTVADRVVQRAVLQVVQPLVDPGFLATAVGGRPGRSPHYAVALADRLWAGGRFTSVAVADVKAAFDVVPHDRLAAAVRAALGDTPAADLVLLLATAGRDRGIPQGGALSPLLLNLLLDREVDRPWRVFHPDLPLVRYIDDVLVLAPDRRAAEDALAEVGDRLAAAGMPLKATSAKVADLDRGETADWLGFELAGGPAGLEARIGEGAWRKLNHQLTKEAHEADNPSERAREAVSGWLGYFGPAFPHADRNRVYDRIGAAGREGGFEELPTYDEMETNWEASYRRYQAVRDRAREEADRKATYRDEGSEGRSAAPPPTIKATSVPTAEGAHDLPSRTPDNRAVSRRRDAPNGRPARRTPTPAPQARRPITRRATPPSLAVPAAWLRRGRCTRGPGPIRSGHPARPPPGPRPTDPIGRRPRPLRRRPPARAMAGVRRTPSPAAGDRRTSHAIGTRLACRPRRLWCGAGGSGGHVRPRSSTTTEEDDL